MTERQRESQKQMEVVKKMEQLIVVGFRQHQK